MIKVINWSNIHLHGSLWAEHHRLRHKLFIERLGWEIPTAEGMEYDGYDTPSAHYLLVSGADNQLAGMARLIPTTRPYMIEQLWPDFMEILPKTKAIWEASRFGVAPHLPPSERERVSKEIVLGCQEFGVHHGIESMLVVMPTPIIYRLMARTGCPYRMLGMPKNLNGIRIGAATIEVSSKILTAVRLKTGIQRQIQFTETNTRRAA